MRLKMTGMSEREALLSYEKYPQPDGKVLYITKNAEHQDYPITDKVIRMDIYKATLAYDVEDGLGAVEFSNFDMKGWFPTKLLNFVLGPMALSNLQDLTKKLLHFKEQNKK